MTHSRGIESRIVASLWDELFSLDVFRPFKKRDWVGLLLPHELLMPTEYWERLRAAALAAGDTEFVVSNVEGREFVVLQWSDGVWSERIHGLELADPSYLFGTSKEWGVMCTHDDFSLLGGSRQFTESYVQAAGGLAAVREEFLEHVSAPGWFVPRDTTERLLAGVGWGKRASS